MTTKSSTLPQKFLLAAFSTAAIVGWADAGQAQSDPMKHPINCATAEGDLRALNSEKKHAQEQQVEGLAAITPAGALLGLIKGDESKKLKMLSGDYEKQLDARIAATEAECGK